MIPYREMSQMGQTASGIFILLLMIMALHLLIAACVLHMGQKKDKIAAFVLVIFVFLLLQNSIDIRWSYKNIFTDWLGNLPYIVWMLLLFFVTVSEAVLLLKLLRQKERRLTPNAVKESLDALPDGVCFFEPDGRPILVNTQMNRISSELFDTEILNAEHFLNRLKENNEKIIRITPTILVKTADEKVWEFSQTILKIKNAEVHELIACDITQQYQLSGELKQRNEQLNKVNERLHRFSRDMVYFTAEKELLEAKIRVHDDVGQALLAFRSYLAQEQEKRNRNDLLLLWRYVILVMKKETAPAGEWDILEKTAQSLHIKINLSGELPENVQQKTAILTAIHECLTNTAKHARGDCLDILVKSEDTLLTAQFTNNGQIPDGDIQEGGGLKNLRNIVERAGGTMTIESTPRFLLRIDFVKNEGEEE